MPERIIDLFLLIALADFPGCLQWLKEAAVNFNQIDVNKILSNCVIQVSEVMKTVFGSGVFYEIDGTPNTFLWRC